MAESSGGGGLCRGSLGSSNDQSTESDQTAGDVRIYIFEQVELRLLSLKAPGSLGA
jgi:hypothetical protein